MNTLIKLIVLLFALSSVASAQTLTNALGGGLSPDDTIVYKKVSGEVTELKLHLFYPEGYDSSKRYPSIVFFFGGGWNGGSASQFYIHAKYLSSRGMVAICPDYRTKKSHGALPYQCVEDGKAAIRYVRAHANELGLDPTRIAAGGGSAGGHVAAATATLERFDVGGNLDVSPVPDALVLFNPVYDNGPDGYGYDRVKDYWELFSPMNNLKAGSPPAIVFFGDSDKLVPVSTAEEYQRRMHELGLRSELHVFANQGHGFFNWGNDKSPDKEVIIATFTAMDTFLASLGFLDGEPTTVDWVATHR